MQFVETQSKGVYDEFEFRGLDYIVASAGKHNIRLVLALGNTWEAYRSPKDFMRMAGVDPSEYGSANAGTPCVAGVKDQAMSLCLDFE